MRSLVRNMFFLLCVFLLMEACSPKIYRPPALGAEYQFDRGLPPAKHPSRLFDKGMRKYLGEKGIQPSQSGHVAAKGQPQKITSKQATIPKDTSTTGDSTAVKDLNERVPTTLHPANKVLPDSSHNAQD